MASWWRDADPARTPELIADLDRAGLLGSPQASPAVATFLGVVAAADPSHVGSWPLEGLDGDALYTLALALWLADEPDATAPVVATIRERAPAEVAAAIDVLVADPPPTLVRLPLEAPVIVDMLWAAHGASGDPAYVERVAEGVGADDPAVAEAARWSLASRVAADADVRAVVAGLAARASGDEADRLTALLEG